MKQLTVEPLSDKAWQTRGVAKITHLGGFVSVQLSKYCSLQIIKKALAKRSETPLVN